MSNVTSTNLRDYTREQAYATSVVMGKAWDDFQKREAEKAAAAAAQAAKGE